MSIRRRPLTFEEFKNLSDDTKRQLTMDLRTRRPLKFEEFKNLSESEKRQWKPPEPWGVGYRGPPGRRFSSHGVKLPAGPHWRNSPEWLEDCEDEFLWAMTGIEQDSPGIVKPLLYYNEGTCSYLVEYPTGSCQYYMFNSITSEIFKIMEPTLLDDIIVELGKVTREVGKPTWEGIKMESIPAPSTMSTLADELLNDFEDSASEGEEENQNGLLRESATPPTAAQANGHKEPSSMVLDGDEEEDDDGPEDGMQNGDLKLEDADDEEEAKAKVEKMQLGGVSDVRTVAGLMKTLEPVLEKIAYYQSLPPDKQNSFVGSVEDNPEYHLLTQANTLSTSIDNEIILVHKFIRDHYSTRFPELETLVTNPLDYAKTVAIIGNGPMDSIKEITQKADNLVGAPLRSILDGPTLMVVTVEATTTRGQNLPATELKTIHRACEMTLSLDRAKHLLTTYVQSRMNLFAPNLTALIGSLTAAQLLNFSGGLTGLAKTPACNLPPLGSKNNKAQTGFATNVGVRHQGFLYHSPLISGIPPDLKKQAMRIVSAKLVLAAR
ncbi:MAG: hypothetical protein Q9199_006157, partial [Rusavskia elegans]